VAKCRCASAECAVLLAHEKPDTTLGYARRYDGTIVADYYRAMSQVERLFHLPESRQAPFYTPAELVTLVDEADAQRASTRDSASIARRHPLAGK